MRLEMLSRLVLISEYRKPLPAMTAARMVPPISLIHLISVFSPAISAQISARNASMSDLVAARNVLKSALVVVRNVLKSALVVVRNVLKSALVVVWPARCYGVPIPEGNAHDAPPKKPNIGRSRKTVT